MIFIFLIVLVWSDNIVQAKIEISIFSLGKGRILAASACPSQTEGRAREGKDPFLPTSTLGKSQWVRMQLIFIPIPSGAGSIIDLKFILPTHSHSEDEVSFLKLGNRPVEAVWCNKIAP